MVFDIFDIKIGMPIISVKGNIPADIEFSKPFCS